MKNICGINAIYSYQENKILLSAKISESQALRGKDATGIGWIDNGSIRILKQSIDPEEFIKKNGKNLNRYRSKILIGHNRSATSGLLKKDEDSEAHPFMSENKDFILVQNGTISKSDSFRELLEKFGHKFSSSVDSECLVHILEELLERNSREEAIKKLDQMDKGNVLILFKNNELYGLPGNIFFNIVKSPNGFYIASTLESLLENIELNESDSYLVYTAGDKSKFIKIYFDQNNKIRCDLHGVWNKFKLKEGSWIYKHTIQCDFCKELKPCEIITINKEEYDRCLECYKSGKDKPKRVYISVNKQKQLGISETIVSRPGEAGICSICFMPVSNDRDLIFCLGCSHFFCQEHFLSHKCNSKEPEFEISDIFRASEEIFQE